MIAPKEEWRERERHGRKGRVWAWAVVAGVGVLIWAIWPDGGGDAVSPKDATGRLIAEAKPGLAGDGHGAGVLSDAMGRVEEQSEVFKSKFAPGKVFGSREEMLAWEESHVSRPGIKTGKKRVETINLVEAEIHRIVNSKPGDRLLPTPLPKRFDEQMQEALLHRLEPEEGDAPEIIEQKRRIEEAKTTLRELLKKGLDLRQVLEEEREALRRTVEMKDALQEHLREVAGDPGATADDLRDAELAANMLLEQQGYEDVEVKARMKDRIRLGLRERELQEQEENTPMEEGTR